MITKTASRLLRGAGMAAKLMYAPVRFGINAGVLPAAKVGFKAAKGVGKYMVKHPLTGIPAAAAIGYGVYNAPGKLAKQRAHIDPNQHYVYQSPILGKLQYRDQSDAFREQAEFQNRFI